MVKVMNEEQYNALDKALDRSHLYDLFGVFQKKDKNGNLTDYIKDYEENKLLSLKKGLEEIDDCLIDFVPCLGFTEEDIVGYDSLMKECNIKTESCRNR